MEDKELYNRFLNGDEKAFEKLIKKYKLNLIYFINKYVKNLEIAEDIFQDTILYILENKDMYNFDYSFKTFLYTIAKSRSLDYLKGKKIIEQIDDKQILDKQSLEDKVFAKFEFEEIKKLLEKLPEDYQMAIYLTKIENFSYKDAAKLMDKTPNQVKMLIHRARKKLRCDVKSKNNYSYKTKKAMLKNLSKNTRRLDMKYQNIFKVFIICIFIIAIFSGLAFATIKIKDYITKTKMTPTFTSKISTIDTNKVWVGTFNLVWNDFMDNVIDGKVEFDDGYCEMADELNKQSFKETQLSENSYFKIYGPSYETDLKSKIENGIKTKFNEESKLLDEIDWDDSNGYILYAMLKKEFNFLEPFSTEMGNINFNGNTSVKCFGVDSCNNPIASKNVEILFFNNEDDFAIKLKTKEKEEVILYKTTGEGKSFEQNYQELLDKSKNYLESKEFGEEDILKIPFLKVNSIINYDELCGRYIKNSNFYIKQAMQTIDFELNNVGGSVKSEAIIGATQKAISQISRKLIFDSDFLCFLKEENKEQPYFALKVDDSQIMQDY